MKYISTKWAAIGLFAVSFAAASTVGIRRYAPRITEITQPEACGAARGYALERLAENAYRDLVIEACPIATTRQIDGSWLTSGTVTASQYGAPVTLHWSARTVAVDSATPRVCNFGIGPSLHGVSSKMLDTPACQHSATARTQPR